MPLYIFLIAYCIFLFIFVVFSLVAIYHLIRFVPPSSFAFFTTYLFLAGALLIIFVSWQILQGIDWTQQFFSFNAEL